MTNTILNDAREHGELMDSELDQVSGGASGLIYAVIAGAQKGATESRINEYVTESAIAIALMGPHPCH
jgi:hypothetical protein